MEQYAKHYAQLLKKEGYSVTTPRKVVFEVLYSYGLQSMAQLIHRCKTIDRASVYRTVELLERVGAVNRVPQGFKYKLELSEAFLPHHHHIVCSTCGKQSDIEQNKLEELLESIAREKSYILSAHKVELQGICYHCAEKANRPIL
jgi:Fe2+ or Zn2+ uptake regulation protein